jgi:hypothetical protein
MLSGFRDDEAPFHTEASVEGMLAEKVVLARSGENHLRGHLRVRRYLDAGDFLPVRVVNGDVTLWSL